MNQLDPTDIEGAILRQAGETGPQRTRKELEESIAMIEKVISSDESRNSMTVAEAHVLNAYVNFLNQLVLLPDLALPFISGSMSKSDCPKQVVSMVMPLTQSVATPVIVNTLYAGVLSSVLHEAQVRGAAAIKTKTPWHGEFPVFASMLPAALTTQSGTAEIKKLREEKDQKQIAIVIAFGDIYNEFEAADEPAPNIIIPANQNLQ